MRINGIKTALLLLLLHPPLATAFFKGTPRDCFTALWPDPAKRFVTSKKLCEKGCAQVCVELANLAAAEEKTRIQYLMLACMFGNEKACRNWIETDPVGVDAASSNDTAFFFVDPKLCQAGRKKNCEALQAKKKELEKKGFKATSDAILKQCTDFMETDQCRLLIGDPKLSSYDRHQVTSNLCWAEGGESCRFLAEHEEAQKEPLGVWKASKFGCETGDSSLCGKIERAANNILERSKEACVKPQTPQDIPICDAWLKQSLEVGKGKEAVNFLEVFCTNSRPADCHRAAEEFRNSVWFEKAMPRFERLCERGKGYLESCGVLLWALTKKKDSKGVQKLLEALSEHPSTARVFSIGLRDGEGLFLDSITLLPMSFFKKKNISQWYADAFSLIFPAHQQDIRRRLENARLRHLEKIVSMPKKKKHGGGLR